MHIMIYIYDYNNDMCAYHYSCNSGYFLLQSHTFQNINSFNWSLLLWTSDRIVYRPQIERFISTSLDITSMTSIQAPQKITSNVLPSSSYMKKLYPPSDSKLQQLKKRTSFLESDYKNHLFSSNIYMYRKSKKYSLMINNYYLIFIKFLNWNCFNK